MDVLVNFSSGSARQQLTRRTAALAIRRYGVRKSIASGDASMTKTLVKKKRINSVHVRGSREFDTEN